MASSEGFRIPIACEDGGRLVPPEEASRGRRYTCPACDGVVDLHAGAVKRRHYHHRRSACSAESVIHLSAKRLVVQAIEEWRSGGAPITFRRRCAERGCASVTSQAIPSKVRRAAEEWRLRTGHVVDVILLGAADLPIAAIEILVSHEVDDDKAFELGLPWIEVDGTAVCASGGRELVPLRDEFLPWLCEEHAHRRGAARREDVAAQKELRSLVRALPYAMSDFPGVRVEGVATCPRGHATLLFGWEGDEPPWPRPPHVVATQADEDVAYDRTRRQARRVLPFRRRWASACVRCGAHVVVPARARG